MIKVAQPVLTWLEEAEEDTESDEDVSVSICKKLSVLLFSAFNNVFK